MSNKHFLLSFNYGITKQIALPIAIEICCYSNTLKIKVLCFYLDISYDSDKQTFNEDDE